VTTKRTAKNACTGCGAPRHETILSIALGHIACCPDCSTLEIEDRNMIRTVVATAIEVGRKDERKERRLRTRARGGAR
jgi:hypothetical protein